MKKKAEDLRFLKTEKQIEDSYLELKKEGCKSIKVNTLCQKAMINKSTFYDHYENIDFLHTYLCRKTINEIMSHCSNINDLFSNTRAFVYSIVTEFGKNMEPLQLLFDGDENSVIKLIEEYLTRIYLRESNSKEDKMKIIFMIGGSARLLIRKFDQEGFECLIRILDGILRGEK